jgi:hypothetical protein
MPAESLEDRLPVLKSGAKQTSGDVHGWIQEWKSNAIAAVGCPCAKEDEKDEMGAKVRRSGPAKERSRDWEPYSSERFHGWVIAGRATTACLGMRGGPYLWRRTSTAFSGGRRRPEAIREVSSKQWSDLSAEFPVALKRAIGPFARFSFEQFR